MKRLLDLLLALLLCFGCFDLVPSAAVLAEKNTDETEAADEATEENETAGIGYIDPIEQFYVVVPVYWSVIGRGSTEQNILDAERILADSGVDANELFETLLSKNAPMFIALGEGLKSGLVLTFGSNEYVSNASMIDDAESIKQSLKAQNPSIRFIEADCGSYSFKSLENILRLHMLEGTNDIDQYYLISGETMFIFTFLNATEEDRNAVFYFFKTGVSKFDETDE